MLWFKTSILLSLASAIFSLPADFPENHEYLVQDLPGIDSIPEDARPLMYAGHIELDFQAETNYFFWKFIKKETNFNRTIIWLNGGPGCSSMDGALMETGPLRVDDDGSLFLNDGSWYHAADMIFVDQPGGTGFSITKAYDRDLDEVGDDFVIFLKRYFEKFPEDAQNEIYIAGESYAGQYIPFIAHSILKANDLNETNINLKGLLIGNGWIEPNIQSLSYIPYLLESGVISQNDEFFPKLLKAQEKCQNEMNDKDRKSEFSLIDCEGILNKVLSYTRDKKAPKDQQCINMYDTRLRDSYPSCGMNWPPALPNVIPFLQNHAVVESLNLNISRIKAWRECDGEVSKYLTNKNSKPAFTLFPDLLKHMEVILFNGNRDIICNNRGVLDLISKLDWAGSKGFTQEVVDYDWKYDGNVAGTFKTENNLTFIDVFESSHMVPFDKPYESRGLFDFAVGNFKIVETLNSTYVETPVYTNKTWSGDEPESEKSSKSVLPFLFYLGTIGMIGLGLYLYNKSKPQRNNSILKNNRRVQKQHGKKTVSWADEGNQASSYKSTEDDESKVGNFLNNFRSNEPGYKRTNTNDDEDEYEDIELQSNSNNLDDFDFDIDDETELAERPISK